MSSIIKVDQIRSDSGTVNFASNVSFTGTQSITIPGNLNLTGGGIKFPASQISSADGNTLDDYEEGTWTPVFSTVGGDYSAITMFNTEGTYTKIGRLVTVTAVVSTTGVITGGSGQTIVKGLPFTVVSGATGAIRTDPSTDIYTSPTALPTVVTVSVTSIALSKNGATNNPAFTELYKLGGNANRMIMTVTYVAA